LQIFGGGGKWKRKVGGKTGTDTISKCTGRFVPPESPLERPRLRKPGRAKGFSTVRPRSGGEMGIGIQFKAKNGDWRIIPCEEGGFSQFARGEMRYLEARQSGTIWSVFEMKNTDTK